MQDLCACAVGHYDAQVTEQYGMLFHTICNKPLECELSYVVAGASIDDCIAVMHVGDYEVCVVHAPIAQEMIDTGCMAMETAAARKLLAEHAP